METITKRTALAATAILGLALVGCSQPAAPTATPVPVSPKPTSTVTPSASRTPQASGPTSTPGASGRATMAPPESPQATPSTPGEIPGELGTLPGGFHLPDEDRPADGDTGAYTTTVWRAACLDGKALPLPTDALTATRVKESLGPEMVSGRGALVFHDDASAQAFMDQLSRGLASCPRTTEPDAQGFTLHLETSPVEGLGDQGLAMRTWTSSTSQPKVPGAGIQYVVREGARVAIAYEAGEYVGDPVQNRELVADSRATVERILNGL